MINNPYEPPAASLGLESGEARSTWERKYTDPLIPMGVIGLFAWLIPGGSTITFAGFTLGLYTLFARRRKRAVVPVVLCGLGLGLYFLSLRF